MTVTCTTRPASADEIAAEMDRRGKVIERLEAKLRLVEQDRVHRGKMLKRVRQELALIETEDEGDRVYFESSNHADAFADLKDRVENWVWSEIVAEDHLPDLVEDCRAANEQAGYWKGVAERALAKQAAFTVALKPFADLGVGEGPDDEPDVEPYRILRGAIRRARAALEGAL